MFIFEITEIIFLVKSFKFPTESFNINNYVSFSTGTTTRSSGIKLMHNSSSTNKQRNHYFIRICCLWNVIPTINLNFSVSIIKIHFFWNHFIINFDAANIHTYYFSAHVAVAPIVLHQLTFPNNN